MVLGVQFRALLLFASADLALVLVGLVLVDFVTDILGHRLAYLHIYIFGSNSEHDIWGEGRFIHEVTIGSPP